MLLKPKIYITVLFVYEIFAVMILHCQYTCTMMLGQTACHDWFRYFAACVIIPGLLSLIWMWIETIYHAYRNRFFHHARGALMNVLDGLCEKLSNNITREDLEHYITVASLYGIRHYMSRNPKFKEVLHEVFPESEQWDIEEDTLHNIKHKKQKYRK